MPAPQIPDPFQVNRGAGPHTSAPQSGTPVGQSTSPRPPAPVLRLGAWLGLALGLAWLGAWLGPRPLLGLPRPSPTRRTFEPIVPWVMPHTTATAPEHPPGTAHIPSLMAPDAQPKVPDPWPPALGPRPSAPGPRPPALGPRLSAPGPAPVQQPVPGRTHITGRMAPDARQKATHAVNRPTPPARPRPRTTPSTGQGPHPWPNGSGCPAVRSDTDATRPSSLLAGRTRSPR